MRTNGAAAWLIRLGERLAHLPSGTNHVIVVHHFKDGVWWGIEGRPSGVGWVDCEAVLASPYTSTNADQPKTAAQRRHIANVLEAAIRDEYSWDAIGEDAAYDALVALHLPDLFLRKTKPGTTEVPGQNVCSSLAAYGYLVCGLPHPFSGHERNCEPGHWDQWNRARGWESVH